MKSIIKILNRLLFHMNAIFAERKMTNVILYHDTVHYYITVKFVIVKSISLIILIEEDFYDSKS